MTNADRIRSMTDEELAEWLMIEHNDCDLCPDYIVAGDCNDGCIAKWLTWLREEAEG